MGVENGGNFELKKVDTEKLEGALADDTVGDTYEDFLDTIHKTKETERQDPESQAPSQEDLRRAINAIGEEDREKFMGGNTGEGGLDGFLDRMHNEIGRGGGVGDGPSDTSGNGDGGPSDGGFEM